MNCPIDGTELVMTHRENVEIDYCPQCRGIWLDRGELDKIIDRSLDMQGPVDDDRDDRKRYDDDDDYRRKQPYDKRKRKSSFLSELFDF